MGEWIRSGKFANLKFVLATGGKVLIAVVSFFLLLLIGEFIFQSVTHTAEKIKEPLYQHSIQWSDGEVWHFTTFDKDAQWKLPSNRLGGQ